jgi:hypothetical protein
MPSEPRFSRQLPSAFPFVSPQLCNTNPNGTLRAIAKSIVYWGFIQNSGKANVARHTQCGESYSLVLSPGRPLRAGTFDTIPNAPWP